jgi:hypothetical protein
MKKLLFLLLPVLATACTTQPKGAQNVSDSITVITAQGHPHDVLTRLHAEGKWQHPQHTFGGSTDNINFADIVLWAGHPTSSHIDSAALIIKWTDDKQRNNILLWGYRWDHREKKTSVDMLRAVANASVSLTVLLLDANISHVDKDTLYYAVGGLGYSYGSSGAGAQRFLPTYKYNDALTDPSIHFCYVCPLDTTYGQTSVPSNPLADVESAINAAHSSGVIEHPLNARTYGYAAYDFDHFYFDPEISTTSWQSGWYHNGYWSFWVKSHPADTFKYSSVGASQRILQHRYVDGWAFAIDFSNVNMGGNYTPATNYTSPKKH